jgi:two-component sensor histidine kinase
MEGAELSILLELPPQPASVSEARRAAARFAQSVGADRAAVELAVAEAVGNAVLHAYPDGPDGRVTVACQVEGSSLALLIRDDGVGMRPDPSTAGLGFGLPLIAQVASALAIADGPDGGTELRMTFPIGDGVAEAGV